MGKVTITVPSLIPWFLIPDLTFAQFTFIILFLMGVGLTAYIYYVSFIKHSKKLSEKNFSRYYAIVNLVGILFFAIFLVRTFSPKMKHYPVIYLQRGRGLTSKWASWSVFGSKKQHSPKRRKFNFSPDSEIQGLGDEEYYTAKKAVFLSPSNQIMDVKKLSARKQLSIVHVDKAPMFFEEFWSVMDQKNEDFWILRLDKINHKLKLHGQENSKLWTKIAMNLVHQLRKEHSTVEKSKLWGWFRSSKKQREKITILVLWNPPVEYKVEKEFYELIYSLQTHSRNVRIVIVSENNAVSKGLQKLNMGHQFVEYSLQTQLLDSGIAVNKGYRNVYAKGLENELEKVLDEEDKEEFEEALDEAEEEKKDNQESKKSEKKRKKSKEQRDELQKKISKIITKQSSQHDVLGSILALSDSSAKNQWVNTLEITNIGRRINRASQRAAVKQLVGEKLLIEDRHRIKFYDDEIFREVKNQFEEKYQSVEIDSRGRRVKFKKKRGWLFRMLYNHLD